MQAKARITINLNTGLQGFIKSFPLLCWLVILSYGVRRKPCFFFFKQKTEYEITRCLEFRRVLFRSISVLGTAPDSPAAPAAPPRPAPAATAASGRIIWTGKLAKNGRLVVERNHA